MCSLCTPQCVLQLLFFKHLIISSPISGFWAAGAFGSAIVSGAATSLATESVESGVVELSASWCMEKQISHQIEYCRTDDKKWIRILKASDVSMGDLCAFVFLWQGLLVQGKTNFPSD